MTTGVKRERQRTIRDLVARGFSGSQEELAGALRDRGFGVTQATISRDIAELGLVRIARGERHLYLTPEDLAEGATASGAGGAGGGLAGQAAAARAASDERLRRILADIPVEVRRSGLTLLVVGSAGTANVIAQAIDDSSLDEQEGTLAGDNTLLVLFADEARLEHWLGRFETFASRIDVGPDVRTGRRPLAALNR